MTTPTHCVTVSLVSKTLADQFWQRHRLVAPGLGMPNEVPVVAEVNGYDVEVLVVAENGRLVAREVRVSRRPDGPPVTSEVIRSVPVAELTKKAARHVFGLEEEESPGSWRMTPISKISESDAARFREAGPTSWTLENVADVYRIALLVGEPPTKAVETTFGIPRSTAGRWVAAAREQGFLGHAEGAGKAGG